MAGLVSLASALTGNKDSAPVDCSLVQLTPGTDEIDETTRLAFQFFPESFQDTKSVNWTTKEIPGASIPLYQWVNSGARSISFTAMFASDIDVSNVTASDLRTAGIERRNVDVRGAIIWLRSFLIPTYAGKSQLGTPVTFAPPKGILRIPNSSIGFFGGRSSAMAQDDEVLVIMTGCDVSIDGFWPSGSIRAASVGLTFEEIVQKAGVIQFHDSQAMYTEFTQSYKIYPKKGG